MLRLHTSNPSSVRKSPYSSTQFICFYDLEEILFKELQLKNPSIAMNFYKKIEGPLIDCIEKIENLKSLHTQINDASGTYLIHETVFYQRLKRYIEDINEWSYTIYSTRQAAETLISRFIQPSLEHNTSFQDEFGKLAEIAEIKKSFISIVKLISRIELYESVATFFWDNHLNKIKIHDNDTEAQFIQIVDSQWDLLLDTIKQLEETPIASPPSSPALSRSSSFSSGGSFDIPRSPSLLARVYRSSPKKEEKIPEVRYKSFAPLVKLNKARYECRVNLYKSVGIEKISKEVKEDLDFSRSENEYFQHYMELEENLHQPSLRDEQKKIQRYKKQSEIACKLTGLARRVRRAGQRVLIVSDKDYALEVFLATKLLFLNNELTWIAEKSAKYTEELKELKENLEVIKVVVNNGYDYNETLVTESSIEEKIRNLNHQSGLTKQKKNNILNDLFLLNSMQCRIQFLAEADLEIKCSLTEFLKQVVETIYVEECIKQIFEKKEVILKLKFNELCNRFGVPEEKYTKNLEADWDVLKARLAEWDEQYKILWSLAMEEPAKHIYRAEGEEVARKSCAERRLIALKKSLNTLLGEIELKEQEVIPLRKKIKDSILKLTYNLVTHTIQKQINAVFESPVGLRSYLTYWLRLATEIPDFNLRLKTIIQYFQSKLFLNSEPDQNDVQSKTQELLVNASQEFKLSLKASINRLEINLVSLKNELNSEINVLNEKLLNFVDFDRRNNLLIVSNQEIKFPCVQKHLDSLENNFKENIADFDRQTDSLFEKSTNYKELIFKDLRNGDEENATFNFLLDNGVLAVSMTPEEIKKLADEKLIDALQGINLSSQDSSIPLTSWMRDIFIYANYFRDNIAPPGLPLPTDKIQENSGQIDIFVVTDIKLFEFANHQPCYLFVKNEQNLNLYFINSKGVKYALKLSQSKVKNNFWEKIPLNQALTLKFRSKMIKMIRGNPGHPKYFPTISTLQGPKINLSEDNPLNDHLKNLKLSQKKPKQRLSIMDEKFIDKDKLDKAARHLLNLIVKLENQAYLLHLEKIFPQNLESFYVNLQETISRSLTVSINENNDNFKLIKSHANLLELVFGLKTRIHTPLGQRLFSDRIRRDDFKIQIISQNKALLNLAEEYTKSLLSQFGVNQTHNFDKKISRFLARNGLDDKKEEGMNEFTKCLENYKNTLVSSYIAINLSEFVLFSNEGPNKTQFIEKFLANIDNDKYPLYRWLKGIRSKLAAESGNVWQLSDLEQVKAAFPEPDYNFLDSQREFIFTANHSGVKEILPASHEKSLNKTWKNYQTAMAYLSLAKKTVYAMKQQPLTEQILFYVDMVSAIAAARKIDLEKNWRVRQAQNSASRKAKRTQQYLLQANYATDLNSLNVIVSKDQTSESKLEYKTGQISNISHYYHSANLYWATRILQGLVNKWTQSQFFENILITKLKTMQVELVLSIPKVVKEKVIYLIKRSYSVDGFHKKEVWCVQYRIKWKKSALTSEPVLLEIVANPKETPSRDQIIPFIKSHEARLTRFINFNLANVDQYLSDEEKLHFCIMTLAQVQSDMQAQLPELTRSLNQTVDMSSLFNYIPDAPIHFNFDSIDKVQQSFMDAKELFVNTFKETFYFSEVAQKYIQKYGELSCNLELLVALKRKNGQNLSDFFGLEFTADLQKPLEEAITLIPKEERQSPLCQYLILLSDGIAYGSMATHVPISPVPTKSLVEYQFQPVIKNVINLLKQKCAELQSVQESGGEVAKFKNIIRILKNSQWVKRIQAVEGLYALLQGYSNQSEINEILAQLKNLHCLLVTGEWRRSVIALPGQKKDKVLDVINLILGDKGLAKIHFLPNINLDFYKKICPHLYVLWCWQFENKYRETSCSLLEEAKNFKHHPDVVELINLTYSHNIADIDLQELAEGNNTQCAIRVNDPWQLKEKLPHFDTLKNNPEMLNQKLIEIILNIFPKHSKTTLLELLKEHYDNCRIMKIAGKLRSFLNHDVIQHDQLKQGEFKYTDFFKTSVGKVKVSNEMPINTLDDAIGRLTEVLHKKTTSAYINKMLPQIEILINYLRAIKTYTDSSRIDDALAEMTHQREEYGRHLLMIRQELLEDGERKQEKDVYLNFRAIINWSQAQQDRFNQQIINVVSPFSFLVGESALPTPINTVKEGEIKSIAKLGDIKFNLGNLRKAASHFARLQCTFLATHNAARLLAAWEFQIQTRDKLFIKIQELEKLNSQLTLEVKTGPTKELVDLYNDTSKMATAEFIQVKAILEEKINFYSKLNQEITVMESTPRSTDSTDEKTAVLQKKILVTMAEKETLETQASKLVRPSDRMRAKFYEQKQAQFRARTQELDQAITQLQIAIKAEQAWQKPLPHEGRSPIGQKKQHLLLLSEEIKNLYQNCFTLLDRINGLAKSDSPNLELTLKNIELPAEFRQFESGNVNIDHAKQVILEQEEKLARLQDEYYELTEHVLQDSHRNIIFELVRQCKEMKTDQENSEISMQILRWSDWLERPKSDLGECRDFKDSLADKKETIIKKIKNQHDQAIKLANFIQEYNAVKAKVENLIGFINKDQRTRRVHKDSPVNLLAIQFQWMQLLQNYALIMQSPVRTII